MHCSIYGTTAEPELVGIARKVTPVVSRHVGHALGAEDGEPHLGIWPIPELAVVLVGGVTRFVENLDPPRWRWFDPPPARYDRKLVAAGAVAFRSRVRASPSVGGLTRAAGLLPRRPPELSVSTEGTSPWAARQSATGRGPVFPTRRLRNRYALHG